MPKFKLAWTGLLVVLFLVFSSWYGGRGKPLTAEEGLALLDRITALYSTSDTSAPPSDFRQNMLDMIPNDDGREFYAVNLETLKAGEEAAAADAEYARHVFPALLKRGSFPVYVGGRAGLMLGQYGDGIDRVAIVRYRSLRDMLDMNTDPAMRDGVPYKFAALEHTEVFITRPIISAFQVKTIVGLGLIVLGIVGWWLPGVIQAMRHARR